MRIIHVSKEDDLSVINEIVNRIKSGQVGVLLTDTIYGFSCAINKREAINKIYQLKGRPKSKPFLILVSDFKMLKKYFFVSSEQESLIRKKYYKINTRPTTYILQAKKNVYNYLNISKENGVAVRLPKNDFLIKIIKSSQQPLISTSCNLSGQKKLNNFFEITSFFNKENKKEISFDFIIKNNNRRPLRKSSKIIDIIDLKNIKEIRS